MMKIASKVAASIPPITAVPSIQIGKGVSRSTPSPGHPILQMFHRVIAYRDDEDRQQGGREHTSDYRCPKYSDRKGSFTVPSFARPSYPSNVPPRNSIPG